MKRLISFLKKNKKGTFLSFLLMFNLFLFYVLVEWEGDETHRYLNLVSNVEAPTDRPETGKAYRKSVLEYLGFASTNEDKTKTEILAVKQIYDVTHSIEREEKNTKSLNRCFRDSGVIQKMKGKDWAYAGADAGSSACRVDTILNPKFSSEKGASFFSGVSSKDLAQTIGSLELEKHQQAKRTAGLLDVFDFLWELFSMFRKQKYYGQIATLVLLATRTMPKQWLGTKFDEIDFKCNGVFTFAFTGLWLFDKLRSLFQFRWYTSISFTSIKEDFITTWTEFTAHWKTDENLDDPMVPVNYQGVLMKFFVVLRHMVTPLYASFPNKWYAGVSVSVILVNMASYLIYPFISRNISDKVSYVWIFATLLSMGYSGPRDPLNPPEVFNNTRGEILINSGSRPHFSVLSSYFYWFLSGCIYSLKAILPSGRSSQEQDVINAFFDVIINIFSFVFFLQRWDNHSKFSAIRKVLASTFRKMKALSQKASLKGIPEMKAIRHFFEQESNSGMYKFLAGLPDDGSVGATIRTMFKESIFGCYDRKSYVHYMYDKKGGSGAKAWKEAFWSYYHLMPSECYQGKTGYTKVQRDTSYRSDSSKAKRPYFILEDVSIKDNSTKHTIDVGHKHGVTILTGPSKPAMDYFKTFSWSLLDAMHSGSVHAKSAKINAPDSVFYIDEIADPDMTYKKLNQAYQYAKDNPKKAVLVLVTNPFLRSGQAARSTYAYCRRFAALRNTTALVYAPYTEIYDLAKSDNFGFYHASYKKDGITPTGHFVQGKGKGVQPLQSMIAQMDPDTRKAFLASARKDSAFLSHHDLKKANLNDYTNPLLVFFCFLFMLIGLIIFFSKRRIL